MTPTLLTLVALLSSGLLLLSSALLIEAASIPETFARDIANSSQPLTVGPFQVRHRIPLSSHVVTKTHTSTIHRLRSLYPSAFQNDVVQRDATVLDLHTVDGKEWKVPVTIGASMPNCKVDTGSEYLVTKSGIYRPGPHSVNLHFSRSFDYGPGDVDHKVTADVYTDTVRIGSEGKPFTVHGIGIASARPGTFYESSECLMGLSPSSDPLRRDAPSLVAHMAQDPALHWNSITVLAFELGGGFMGLGAGDGTITQFVPLTSEKNADWQVASTFLDNTFHRTLIDSGTDGMLMSPKMLRSISGALGLQTVQLSQKEYTCMGGRTDQFGKDLQIRMEFGSEVSVHLHPNAYWWYTEGGGARRSVTRICAASGLDDNFLVAGSPLFLSAVIAFDYNNRLIGFYARN